MQANKWLNKQYNATKESIKKIIQSTFSNTLKIIEGYIFNISILMLTKIIVY